MDKKEAKMFVLPSLFGLHRGWTVIIAFVLFLLLLGIVPSFFHMGRRVHFSASYYPFALSVDDKDMYLVPGDVYLKPGRHTAYMHINGKKIAETSFRVRPSLFYSWLFEGKKKVFINVSDESINAVYDDIIAFFLSDASLYSLVFNEAPTSAIRNIYSDIKTELPQSLYEKALPIINTASRLIASDALKTDAEKNGVVTNYYKLNGDIEKKSLIEEVKNSYETTIGGIRFVGDGDTLISKSLITEGVFYEFLKENPEWDVDKLDALIGRDKADSFYLSGFTANEKSLINVPITIANAFATWFSKKYAVNAIIASTDELLHFKSLLSLDKAVPWEFTSTVFENASFVDGVKGDFSVFEKYGIPLSMECINLSEAKKDGDSYIYPLGGVQAYLSYPTMGFRLMIKEASNEG